jgi:hypothetical protein
MLVEGQKMEETDEMAEGNFRRFTTAAREVPRNVERFGLVGTLA